MMLVIINVLRENHNRFPFLFISIYPRISTFVTYNITRIRIDNGI